MGEEVKRLHNGYQHREERVNPSPAQEDIEDSL